MTGRLETPERDFPRFGFGATRVERIRGNEDETGSYGTEERMAKE